MTRNTGEWQRIGGAHRDDVLALLREHPGATVPQLAGAAGIREGIVWLALSALSRQGRVKRFGQGWRVIDR